MMNRALNSVVRPTRADVMREVLAGDVEDVGWVQAVAAAIPLVTSLIGGGKKEKKEKAPPPPPPKPPPKPNILPGAVLAGAGVLLLVMMLQRSGR